MLGWGGVYIGWTTHNSWLVVDIHVYPSLPPWGKPENHRLKCRGCVIVPMKVFTEGFIDIPGCRDADRSSNMMLPRRRLWRLRARHDHKDNVMNQLVLGKS